MRRVSRRGLGSICQGPCGHSHHRSKICQDIRSSMEVRRPPTLLPSNEETHVPSPARLRHPVHARPRKAPGSRARAGRLRHPRGARRARGAHRSDRRGGRRGRPHPARPDPGSAVPGHLPIGRGECAPPRPAPGRSARSAGGPGAGSRAGAAAAVHAARPTGGMPLMSRRAWLAEHCDPARGRSPATPPSGSATPAAPGSPAPIGWSGPGRSESVSPFPACHDVALTVGADETRPHRSGPTDSETRLGARGRSLDLVEPWRHRALQMTFAARVTYCNQVQQRGSDDDAHGRTTAGEATA